MSDLLYFVALLFYMQAMPVRLIYLSIVANVAVLAVKLYLGRE